MARTSLLCAAKKVHGRSGPQYHSSSTIPHSGHDVLFPHSAPLFNFFCVECFMNSAQFQMRSQWRSTKFMLTIVKFYRKCFYFACIQKHSPLFRHFPPSSSLCVCKTDNTNSRAFLEITQL